MDRGTWQATVRGIPRVGHDLVTKPPPLPQFFQESYGCERWTIKKVELRRTDIFELWCWIRLVRVLWTARRLNQSILKEINPE